MIVNRGPCHREQQLHPAAPRASPNTPPEQASKTAALLCIATLTCPARVDDVGGTLGRVGGCVRQQGCRVGQERAAWARRCQQPQRAAAAERGG